MESFEKILNEEGQVLELYNRQYQEVEARHKYMTAYYGVDPKDDMVDKSEEFFKVFQHFFKNIDQSVPTTQRPKDNKAGGGVNPLLKGQMNKPK